jgi:hypothetical protein
MCSTFQGAIGGKALLETVRSHPKQAEALRKSNGKAGWISARDVRAFYSTQEVSQLYRDAPALSKSRVKVPKPDALKPLRHLQADSISLKGLPSGRYTGVINIIDVFSQYSWQVPVQTVGSASEAAAAVNLAMKRIKSKFDLPEAIDLQTDTVNIASFLLLRRVSNKLFPRFCEVIEAALHYGSPMQAFRALGGVDGAGEDSYEATVEEYTVRYHRVY